MQRKDEILAKKAKLAELRRQREEREQRQKEGRRETLLDDGSGIRGPTPRRSTDRQDLDSFIESLVGERPGSQGPGTGTASPARRSRPSSTLSAVQVGSETYEQAHTGPAPSNYTTSSTQTGDATSLLSGQTTTASPHKPPPETYSKGVQTSEPWSPQRPRRSSDAGSDSGLEVSPTRSPRAIKKLTRRQREREAELRENLRKEIEEELLAARDLTLDGKISSAPSKFPARALTNEELNAVTSSDDFVDFVDRSSKVIEKSLDQDYDVLADYALDGLQGVDDEDDEDYGGSRGKPRRKLKQVAQFWDERWSKNRMTSDLGFSPKVRKLAFRLHHNHLSSIVSGAAACLLHEEHIPTTRSFWPPTSMEHASTLSARVYLP